MCSQIFIQSKRNKYQEIFRYLGEIIFTFRKENDSFDYNYFTIFLHNIDVWGFVSIYIAFMDIDETFNDLQLRKLKVHIRKLISEYLFKYSCEPIPIQELVSYLESLNKLYYSVDENLSVGYIDSRLSKTISNGSIVLEKMKTLRNTRKYKNVKRFTRKTLSY